MAAKDDDSGIWGDIGYDAGKRVGTAVSKIDLDGIADSIGDALNDAARALGLTEDHDSPYIIREKGAERRTAVLMGRGVILLLIGLPFVFSAPILLLTDIAYAAVSAVIGVPALIQGVRHVRQANSQKIFNRVIAKMDRKLGFCQRINVAHLAGIIDVPTEQVQAVLPEAIERGVIPEGRLSGSGREATLYLTAGAWDEAHAGGASKPRQAAQDGRHAKGAAPSPEPSLPEEAVKVLDACDSFASDLVASRNAVADEDVRASLDGIVAKIRSICSYVRKHPETASQLRKMTSYYLPTTAKLAASYAELEGRGGSQAQSTCEELKETLALVDGALAKLSDELMREQSWDLKADMDVMRQMLDQDGLS